MCKFASCCVVLPALCQSVWRVSRGPPSSTPASTSSSKETMKTTLTWQEWCGCSAMVSLSNVRLPFAWRLHLAQHLFLYCVSESGKQKKAVVQWFVRVSEIPTGKLKLLGRQPHPQEIFYYECRNCDDEVDVGSILRPVQVRPPSILLTCSLDSAGSDAAGGFRSTNPLGPAGDAPGRSSSIPSL